MRLSHFEQEIMFELYGRVGRQLKAKELLEWSTGRIKARPGEQIIFLPNARVFAAIPAKIKLKATP